MHKFANATLSIALAALSAALAAGQSQPDQLIGRWRSTQVSTTGVSAIFEFHGDGQLDSYAAAISDDTYRLIGTDTIVLQSKTAEEKLGLEWDSPDRARIEDEAAGKFTSLARIGKIPDSKNQLVGDWSTMREWNGKSYPARALFFPDGRAVWITTLRSDHGRYAVQNKNIRIEIPGRPVVDGSITVTADRLTLPNPKGGESIFERF